jgi:hypothetical protein
MIAKCLLFVWSEDTFMVGTRKYPKKDFDANTLFGFLEGITDMRSFQALKYRADESFTKSLGGCLLLS